MMRKTNEGRSPAGILLPAAAAGLLATLLLMLVGAVLMHQGTLPEGAVAPCALVFWQRAACSPVLLQQSAQQDVSFRGH